ncbi:hypothetical protein D1007_08322 [Hordeum vulgare]|nr:uncharacterized protein LOC123409595 [Hordeum vulgare subsp. vulgare]KAE8814263.1 hypothetical protein D1007_08322 [Hordeum vulgare]
MPSPAPPSSPDADGDAATPPASLPAIESQAELPDHLVEDILIRLPAAVDLGRASMAAASFHRTIAGHSFLRRFRALHPPPLLGILTYNSAHHKTLWPSFLPAQPPHPSAAIAALTLAAADFSCSFLPSRELWSHCDYRDGRILLSKKGDFLANVAVCDPLHRRYLLLPAIPDDLAALSRQMDVTHCEPFLAPAGEDQGGNGDAPSGFRVMCLRMSSTNLVLFVFSWSGARAGQWHTVTFDGWGAFMNSEWVVLGTFPDTPDTRRYYAHGCFYWEIPYPCKLLVFDTRTEEFSFVSLPDRRRQNTFVEATDGRLGMYSRRVRDRLLDDGMRADENHLLYDILQDNGDGTKWWKREDVIQVPRNYRYNIIGVAGGYLLLHAYLHNPESPYGNNFNYYSIDRQTLKIERFRGSRPVYISPDTHLYTGFPPSLSPPTI